MDHDWNAVRRKIDSEPRRIGASLSRHDASEVIWVLSMVALRNAVDAGVTVLIGGLVRDYDGA